LTFRGQVKLDQIAQPGRLLPGVLRTLQQQSADKLENITLPVGLELPNFDAHDPIDHLAECPTM
jgi:hypothetical protein